MPRKDAGEQHLMEVHFVGEIIQGMVSALALSVEVFIHKGFGAGYIGGGVAALLDLLLCAKCFSGENVRPLAVFAGLYTVFWLVAVVNVLVRWWRGAARVHSHYNGRPFFCATLTNWKEINVKHLESFGVILLGYGILHLNRPLGAYLLMSGIVVLVRNYTIASAMRKRAVELHDAVLEQKEVGEEFRQMQHE